MSFGNLWSESPVLIYRSILGIVSENKVIFPGFGFKESIAKSLFKYAVHAPNLHNAESSFCYNKSATMKTLIKKFVGIIVYLFWGWT